MPRERSMSGTIPSMETAHDDLKDNTIIVGVYHFPCLLIYTSHGAQCLVPLVILQRKKWGSSLYFLNYSRLQRIP